MTTDPASPLFTDEEPDHDLRNDVSFDDQTPYATAREIGSRGFFKMSRWVWSAGKNRLTHIGLSRPSPHSRRFARINILLLAVVVGLCTFANAGWHQVWVGPGIENQAITPTGKGWTEVVSCNNPGQKALGTKTFVSSIWVNLSWASLAGSIGFVSTFILGMLLTGLMATLAHRSLASAHRTDSRMRAGIHYGTSWLQYLCVAGLVFCLRPITVLGSVADWPMTPPRIFIDASALLIAILGLMLGWFWMIRLGGAVPGKSAPTVSRFFVFWMPLYVTLVVGGAIYGLYVLSQHWPRQLNLNW